MTLHPAEMNAADLQDRLDCAAKTCPAMKTRELEYLQHILFLQDELERERYRTQCAGELAEQWESDYRRLEGECLRFMRQARQGSEAAR